MTLGLSTQYSALGTFSSPSSLRRFVASSLFLLFLAATAPLYQNNFETLQPNSPLPDDLRIHEGSFSVRAEPGNKFLELAAAPVGGYGFSVGPQDQALLCLSARIRGHSTAARRPEFGLGLCGLGGYKLWLMPMTDQLQLIKGEDLKASVPFSWQSGQWTRLKLRLRQTSDTTWRLEGKAWPDNQPEPAAWTIAFDETEKPIPGQPSLWGSPYSDQPIAFDDILIERAD